MTRPRLTLLSLAIAVGAMLGLGAVPADAHTCSSSCNQIRRACRASTRAIHKIARMDCNAERDACRVVCEADPAICPDGECEACEDDCDLVRVDCRTAAKDVQTVDQATCDVMRTSCNDICQDPIDGVCVKECKADAHHACVRPARLDYRHCKQQCPTGTGRQACVRYCRREMNADLDLCFDGEMLCVAQCIGVSLDAPPVAP
jgi:hypothetical protein